MENKPGNPVIHKKLQEEFTRGEESFKMIKRHNDLAIFKVTTKNGECFHDTIKVGRHDGYTLAGIYTEPSETYPGPSLYDMVAWRFSSLDDAEKKFSQLIKEEAGQ